MKNVVFFRSSRMTSWRIAKFSAQSPRLMPKTVCLSRLEQRRLWSNAPGVLRMTSICLSRALRGPRLSPITTISLVSATPILWFQQERKQWGSTLPRTASILSFCDISRAARVRRRTGRVVLSLMAWPRLFERVAPAPVATRSLERKSSLTRKVLGRPPLALHKMKPVWKKKKPPQFSCNID